MAPDRRQAKEPWRTDVMIENDAHARWICPTVPETLIKQVKKSQKTAENGLFAPEKVWASTQQHLRSMLSPEIYNLWFAPIQPKGLEGDCLTLEVANDFCEVWLEKNYLDLIQEK